MIIAEFFKVSSLKKIRPITFIVWVLGRAEKMPKKGKKMSKYFFCFKQISKLFLHTLLRAFQKYSF